MRMIAVRKWGGRGVFGGFLFLPDAACQVMVFLRIYGGEAAPECL